MAQISSKNLTLSLLFFTTFLITPTILDAKVIADFSPSIFFANTTENRFETTLDSELWITMDMGHSKQIPSVISGNGYDGQPGFGQVDIISYGDDGDYKTYIFYKANRYDNAYEYTAGNNRMTLYMKLPDGKFHFHLGTYTRDPSVPATSTNMGAHYYHYYDIKGTNNKYWTKMTMNNHPTHQVNVETDPGDNPESWNYIEGLTRIYHEMKYSTWPGEWKPYSVQIDGIGFYNEARPENDYSINNICATYYGNGEFNLDWRSFSQYDIHYETFEVRYATSPINTITDYNNAILVPGSPEGGWGKENIGHHDNGYRANFTLPSVVKGKTYYFAVKDLYPNHPKEITRIDYIAPETYSSTTGVHPTPEITQPIILNISQVEN